MTAYYCSMYSILFLFLLLQDLLSIIPSWQRDEPTWAELRQFGVGWWMRNVNTIRKCAEKVDNRNISY